MIGEAQNRRFEESAQKGSVQNVKLKKYKLELSVLGPTWVGVGDIIEKNYRQPIYRNFSNYRQIIDIEFWEFGNYRKIIDIENCIQFYPINTIESIVLKTRKGPR